LGKVVICSNFGEPSHIITNGVNGILVENKPENFANAIVELFKNQKYAQSISEKARLLFIEHFSHVVLMKKLEQFVYQIRRKV
jgi:glycosyltransferase involved in cell wall biosynthesis